MRRTARLRQEAAATFVLALPIVAGQLLAISLNVIDTMLAGGLGTHVQAAVAMGSQAWVVVLLVLIGVLLAVTPAVAQLDGAGRRGETGAVFRQALWLALGLGISLGLLLREAEPLLRFARVDATVVPDAVAFMRAIAWGAPALALYFTCKNFSEGLSLTRPTMYFGLLGVFVLVPVAWGLMYGRLGLPALGAAGAGYAHALTLWVQAISFLGYLALRRHYREARPFASFDWPDARQILSLLRIGVPMAVSICMEGGLFVATALLAGSLGAVPAAAHQIALNVASVTFMVPFGVAMAATVRVGNAVGRRDADAIAWAGAAAFVLVLACQLVAVVLMLVFARPIVDAYTDDAAVLALGITLIGYGVWFQFSDGIQALANGALRGLKDTLVPAIVTTLAYWGIGFPVGWWLGLERGLGAPGLWIGFIAGLTASALLLGARFVALARRARTMTFVTSP
ncbi:MAG TPA: MATE family efflux transporter [Candidatus Saccharimonadia bacterium]|nr:MATE family efflux transporter [Candidatus Saccharimonadia bacterium]